jgi:hypothetical protein
MTTPDSPATPITNPTGTAVPPGPAGAVPQLPAQTTGTGLATGPTVVVGTYPDYTLAQRAVTLEANRAGPAADPE